MAVQHEVSYKWKIKNFLNRPEKLNEKLISPVFYSKTSNEKTWQLELFPRGDTIHSENYVALYIRMKTLQTSEEYRNEGVSVVCELSIINSATKKKCYKLHFKYNFSKYKSLVGYRCFISRDVLSNEENGYLSDGILMLNCQLKWHSGDLNTPDVTELERMSAMTSHGLADDLKHHLGNSEYSDVTLIVKGRRIPAHKVILAARSPVFAAMFKYPGMMKNEVKIEGFELRVIGEMLNYVYTDQIKDEGLAVELLRMADMYQLDGLKTRCETMLVRQLSPLNAVRMLETAEVYNAHELKIRAIGFIHDWGIGSKKRKNDDKPGEDAFARDVDVGEIPEVEMEIVG